MINKIKIYARLIEIVICVILFVSLLITLNVCKHYQQDNNRLKSNQKELTEGLNIYRDKMGASIAEAGVITLKKNEFENLYNNKVQECKKLNIDIKRLKSYAQTSTNTNIPINTVLHDSVFVFNNKIDTLRCLSYKDNYFSIDGCINNDTLSGHINSIDTLIQTVSVVPKHFLFFKWGVRGIKQTIKSKNPYTTIISSEYIRIE